MLTSASTIKSGFSFVFTQEDMVKISPIKRPILILFIFIISFFMRLLFLENKSPLIIWILIISSFTPEDLILRNWQILMLPIYKFCSLKKLLSSHFFF